MEIILNLFHPFHRHINLCNRYGKNGLFFPVAQNDGRRRPCVPKAQFRQALGYFDLSISLQELIEARLSQVFKLIWKKSSGCTDRQTGLLEPIGSEAV